MKLAELVTDYDNKTLDTARSIAVYAVVALTLFQGVSTYKTGVFDAMAFGGGIAAICACLGIAIAGDNHKRPEPEDRNGNAG
jgi:hypothetical protein